MTTRVTTKRAHFVEGARIVVITAPPCHATNQTIFTTGGVRLGHRYQRSETTVAVEVVLRSSGTLTVRSTSGAETLELLAN